MSKDAKIIHYAQAKAYQIYIGRFIKKTYSGEDFSFKIKCFQPSYTFLKFPVKY